MYGDCPCSARSCGTTGRSDPPSPGMYTRMTSGTLTEDRTSVKLVLSEIPRSAGEMPSRPDRSSNSTPQLSALPPFTQVLSSSVDGRTATSMGLSEGLVESAAATTDLPPRKLSQRTSKFRIVDRRSSGFRRSGILRRSRRRKRALARAQLRASQGPRGAQAQVHDAP